MSSAVRVGDAGHWQIFCPKRASGECALAPTAHRRGPTKAPAAGRGGERGPRDLWTIPTSQQIRVDKVPNWRLTDEVIITHLEPRRDAGGDFRLGII